MTFRIQIKNRFGLFQSGAKFRSALSARKAVSLQKRADKNINDKGYLDMSGRIIKMTQRYKVVKV